MFQLLFFWFAVFIILLHYQSIVYTISKHSESIFLECLNQLFPYRDCKENSLQCCPAEAAYVVLNSPAEVFAIFFTF